MPTKISLLPTVQQVGWDAGAGSNDTGLARASAGLVNVTNGGATTYLTMGIDSGSNGLISNASQVKITGGNQNIAVVNGTGLVSSFSVVITSASGVFNIANDVVLERQAAGQWLMGNGTTGGGRAILQLGINTGVNALIKCVNPTATTGASVAGRTLTVESGDAVASTDTAGAAAGGDLNFNAGDAARLTSGNATGGSITLTPGAGIGTGGLGTVKTYPATAIPAAGALGVGLTFSSTANFGVFFGSGAPTLVAAKGSLYLRSDGSGIADRMYVNTDGSTAWTNVVTGA